MKLTKRKALLLILVSVLLFACDRKEKEEIQPKVTAPEPPKSVTLLDVVPADTIFFSGGLQPFPLKEILQWEADTFNAFKGLDPKSLFPEMQEKETFWQRMGTELWLSYSALLLSPEAELKKWGIQEKTFSASYTVGLAPVFRISLQDVTAFENKLDELEAKVKITHTSETLGQATYRRYALKKSASVDLIIGVDNKHKQAVVMLDLGVDSEQTLAIALGQQKPEKTLADSGRVEALQKQYNLHPAKIGYIDHQQLITGLTTKEGNSVAKMLQSLASQLHLGVSAVLNELQTDGCRHDLEAIGKNWPQTVFGYTTLDLTASPSRIDSLLVLENKDKALLESLQSLRGFIPQYANNATEQPVVAAGIGLNVEKIAPFLTQRWAAITQKEYKCSFLKDIQKDIKSQQPMALAMMTGMAPGVQGLAFSLMSLELEGKKSDPPLPKSMDALISLAVKNPTVFIQTVSALFPPLAQLELSADGTPVQLPIPFPLPFPVMAAIHGSHVTVYTGEKSKALSQSLRSDSLDTPSGLLATHLDYGKYYGLIGDALQSVDIPEAQQAETKALFEAMKGVTLRMQMNMDVTDRGLEIALDMTTTD
ncbi:MAG: hypothetical protein D3919_00040 [Candidatus Electrothrix sp. AW5]|nr:hypothetical protein [Candidatus Electrothrix sp. AX1]MCI5181915.1 hypothetical protein [Candidatus Electrothrix gigas]MCI5194626.1 hypothetical protein [Candidatus Electrothrix gigas]